MCCSVECKEEKSSKNSGRYIKKWNIEAIIIRTFELKPKWKVTSKFKDENDRVLFECDRGHEVDFNWYEFNSRGNSNDCKICKRIDMMYRIKLYIESIPGWKCHTTEYKNPKTKLDLECPHGHAVKMCWNSFYSSGRRCLKCSGKEKFTYESVKKYIESFPGYLLLSTEYKDNKTKLYIQCPNGHKFWMHLRSFRENHRCKQCCYDKRSGPTAWNWRPERSFIKTSDEYHALSKPYRDRFKKEYFLTHMLDMSIKYHVDHIFPIQAFIDYNIKDLEIINDPTNLQMLTYKQNISKGAKYSVRNFFKWLRSKGLDTKKLKKAKK